MKIIGEELGGLVKGCHAYLRPGENGNNSSYSGRKGFDTGKIFHLVAGVSARPFGTCPSRK
ncbi:hypothetical protein RUM43_002411 [Polyplax serrata]|uniref:Uncharacterized protein n=1 Tax=Polyplax serrata TaxID=468196 RepID=A0AAN8S973_POLSC